MKRIAFLLCLLAFPASAETLQCLPAKLMAGYLEKNYEERLMFVAVGGTEEAPYTVQIWASRTKRTFTLLGIKDDDVACILWTGRNLAPASGNPIGEKPEQKS